MDGKYFLEHGVWISHIRPQFHSHLILELHYLHFQIKQLPSKCRLQTKEDPNLEHGSLGFYILGHTYYRFLGLTGPYYSQPDFSLKPDLWRPGGSWSIKVSYGSHDKVGKENESHYPFRPVHFTHGMYTKRKWNFHSDLRHIFSTYVTMFSKSFLVHHVCEVFFKKVREATKKFPWSLLKQEVESIRGHSW